MAVRTIAEIQKELHKKPLQRSFVIERDASVNEETRTVELAFASDKAIEHWFGALELSMKPKAMRTARLENGAALLMDHNPTDQIGVVENFNIDKGIARATVRFSDSQRADEVFRDVKNGIRRNVSVGFMVHKMELTNEKDTKQGAIPQYRSDDWEPYEISIVSIPADISVGVGRDMTDPQEEMCPECGQPMVDAEGDPHACQNSAQSRAISTQPEKTMSEPINTPEAPAVERTEDIAARTKEIVAFAEIFGEGDLARQMVAGSSAVTLEDVRAAINARRKAPIPAPEPQAPTDVARQNGVQLARAIPRHAKPRHFRGENAAEKAYRFGQWFMAALLGRSGSIDFCNQNGILVRTQQEGVNEKGGFLVPEEFGNDLIDLREEYGVFRRNANVVPMASETRSDPRRTGGLTAYFVAESGSITASDLTWDRVQLVAKKLAVMARLSSEVSEDAAVSIGDKLAGEIAYAFANKEDECGFNGDGSSTYGGIVGVREKIKGLSGTIANIAGLKVGTGNAYSELTLADFRGTVALLPQYADTPGAKWFVHRSFYYDVMVGLLLAGGGVTAGEIESDRGRRFLGYDVEFSQVLPKTEANSQVCALLGDLSKAASLGSRNDTSIALSEHSRFANDEIEVRGTERFDINVHDVGNASATAGSRVAGPVVGLITAAS